VTILIIRRELQCGAMPQCSQGQREPGENQLQ
jgi:hypothetical protein